MYSYLTDDNFHYEKDKMLKTCVTKPEIKFQDCRNCLKINKIILKSPVKYPRSIESIMYL